MTTWVEVYTRCMDGEYFFGDSCPRDGFSSETSIEITLLVAALREEGKTPSINELVSRGFQGSIDDNIVVEFASHRFVPDWLTPNVNRYGW
jgi:hypothetical protein